MRLLLSWLLLVLGPFLSAGGGQVHAGAVWARELGPSPGTRTGFVELRPGQGLDRLLPARTLRRLGGGRGGPGRLDLPAVPHGDRRLAVVLTGCDESSTPELVLRGDRVRVAFSRPSGAECLVADHTVAVFDLAPDLARRVLAGPPDVRLIHEPATARRE